MTGPQAPSLPRPVPSMHHLLSYGCDEQFLDAAVPFARDGLAAGEPVFIATTRRNTALLQRHLGPHSDKAVFAPAHWYRPPAQALLAFHTRAHTTSGPSRVLGEASWAGLSLEEVREWNHYEALLTLALASTGAWHLCPYDTRVLPADVLHTAQLTHPALTTAHTHRPNPDHITPEQFSASCPCTPLHVPARPSRQLPALPLRQLTADHRTAPVHRPARPCRGAARPPDRQPARLRGRSRSQRRAARRRKRLLPHLDQHRRDLVRHHQPAGDTEHRPGRISATRRILDGRPRTVDHPATQRRRRHPQHPPRHHHPHPHRPTPTPPQPPVGESH